MNNYYYFEYSKNNPEELFDPFYKKGNIVIPKDSNVGNMLTKNNSRMIECITAFKVLISKGYKKTDKPIIDVVNEIIEILIKTTYINYSAFSQFFMVYNSTYNYFKKLERTKKFDYIYEMLINYCEERHEMYLSHGYTNVVLQVMSDNYSHKRNSKSSIEKVLSIINCYNLQKIKDISCLDGVNYYFLPDKGDSCLFEAFIKKFNLKMESRAIEQNKLPDIVFNCNGEFYICELKTMKGHGGGQNKQIVEVAYFIKFSEEDSKFHYLAFLDGDYSNTLFNSNSPKIVNQRKDISNALKENSGNYFVNTAGFKKLTKDIFENNMIK